MLSEAEQGFVRRAVQRKRVFLVLSVVGVLAALGLGVWAFTGESSDLLSLRLVLVVFVLLNSRQNLRQYKYACVIEKLLLAKASPPLVSNAG